MAAFVIIGLICDFFGTFLTGLGLRSTDPNKKYKYYRVAIYALVVARESLHHPSLSMKAKIVKCTFLVQFLNIMNSLVTMLVPTFLLLFSYHAGTGCDHLPRQLLQGPCKR